MKTKGVRGWTGSGFWISIFLMGGVSPLCFGQAATTAPAPAPPADNLLRNGGFEEGNLVPTGWQKGDDVPGVEYLWTSGVAFEGRSSVCLQKTANRFWPIAEWVQDIDYSGSGGDTLAVSAMVKAQNVAKAIIDVQFRGDNGPAGHKWAVYLGAKEPTDPPVSHDWKSYSGEAPIPAGTKSIRVALQMYGPGVVAFDSLRASLVGSGGARVGATTPAAPDAVASAPPGAPGPSNPSTGNAAAEQGLIPISLVNPGFEEGTGQPSGWTPGNPVPGVEVLWAKDAAHAGSASLCFRKTVDRYFPIAQWTQEFPKDRPARAVRIRAWMKAESASKAILDAQFIDAAGNWSHKWVVYIGAKTDNDPPATFDWKEVGGDVPIPPNTEKIAIGLQIYGPGTVWFDDVRAGYLE